MTTAIPSIGGIRAYIAGPMRNYKLFNFPAFDECAEWLRSKGWDAVNPAEMDRELGLDPSEPLPEWFSLEHAMHRDLHEVTHPLTAALVMLPGWAQSGGAVKEVTTAMACGHDIYLYEPDGIFDDYLNGGMFDDDKRLVQVSYPLVEAIIQTNREQAEHDEQYMLGEHRVTSSTGGQKGQKDGLRYDLIPSEALEEVAKVYGYGATKYSPNNWKLGYDYSLSLASLERHLHAWKQGERTDSEGFMHLGALVFHALTLIYRDKFQPEWDDVHDVRAVDLNDTTLDSLT